MAQSGFEPWPFTSKASILSTELAGQLVKERATRCTNKPYPVVKNMYYIMFVYSTACR